MTRGPVERLAAMPGVFDALRWTLEGGFRGHHDVLRRELPPGGAVLDCGCGTGVFAGRFDPGGYVGIDLDPAYVAAARRRHPGHRFEVMDARRLAFPDGSFDRAFVSGVLHHLDDPDCRRVLGELARVLRPGGELAVWEDVPARARANLVGGAVHRLDLGRHIRPADGYRRLIGEALPVAADYPMRSGFMDYHVFRCRKA